LYNRSSIEKTREMMQTFLDNASFVTSIFHTIREEGRIAILHDENTNGVYEEARDAIARDLEHVLRPHSSQQSGVTYSVHYSDINGLSRLENYILGCEIADYLSKFKVFIRSDQI
jgi:hypothetical protein